jgi:Ribonuclease HIII
LSVERSAFSEMNSYTHLLSPEQVRKLRAFARGVRFEFAPKEWTIFFAQKNKLSVAVYEKGPKVLVQGRGVEEFVQFELEPKFWAKRSSAMKKCTRPKCSSRISVWTKAGKGDFFGPLVISGVYVDRGIARKLLDGASWTASGSAPMRGFARWRTRFGKLHKVWWKWF